MTAHSHYTPGPTAWPKASLTCDKIVIIIIIVVVVAHSLCLSDRHMCTFSWHAFPNFRVYWGGGGWGWRFRVTLV